MNIVSRTIQCIHRAATAVPVWTRAVRSYLDSRLPRRINPGIWFGKWLHHVPQGSLVFFPCRQTILGCGLAGIVAYKRAAAAEKTVDA
ncbi:MAG: hypothetical protein LJE65_09220, partial [Desulfobacteraceae bacterium]|nr:hypothetical protein [Desulfobacteraceae bacterium]